MKHIYSYGKNNLTVKIIFFYNKDSQSSELSGTKKSSYLYIMGKMLSNKLIEPRDCLKNKFHFLIFHFIYSSLQK